MPNFGSFFRRKAPIVVTSRFNQANLNKMNGQVSGLVTVLRNLKKKVPINNQKTNNAFINATAKERNDMSRAILSFIRKYNTAVNQTATAATAPTPTNVNNAQKAVNAAIKELNNFMAKAPITGSAGGNAAALLKYYKNSGRSIKTNSNTNAKRAGGVGRYNKLWAELKPAKPVNPQNQINKNMLNAIKVIATNTSRNNNTKKANIQTRFPNVNYFNLSNKTNNAETRRILKLLSLAAAPNKSNIELLGEEKNARIKNAILKLWGHAGSGSGSNSNNYRRNVALPAARGNQGLMNLMTNNISRANFNSVLNNPGFVPPTNTSGANRERHTARVKKMLENLGWTKN